MSAFLVSKAHIDALVYARSLNPYRGGKLDQQSNDDLGRMLWRENMLSLAARYCDPVDESALDGYRYDPVAAAINDADRLSVVALLKAIDCYRYQSCEHEGWEASDSARFCDQLAHVLIGLLPGYDAAPWGID